MTCHCTDPIVFGHNCHTPRDTYGNTYSSGESFTIGGGELTYTIGGTDRTIPLAGGRIYMGPITADQITAGSITTAWHTTTPAAATATHSSPNYAQYTQNTPNPPEPATDPHNAATTGWDWLEPPETHPNWAEHWGTSEPCP